MKNKVLKRWIATIAIAGIATAVPLGTIASSKAADSNVVRSAYALETEEEAEAAPAEDTAPITGTVATETTTPEPAKEETAPETPKDDSSDASQKDTGDTDTTQTPSDTPGSEDTDPSDGTGSADPGTISEGDEPQDPDTPADPEDPENPEDGTENPEDPESEAPAPESTTPADATPSGEAVPQDGESTDNPDADKDETQSAVSDETLQSQIASWIASGMIVPSPVIIEDFRFWTVAQDPAFATEDLSILEEKSADATAIGTLAKDGLCYIISDEGNGWTYVESGSVRGFVKSDLLISGEAALDQMKSMVSAAGYTEEDSVDFEEIAATAEELVAPRENKAFDYKRMTVYQTVVDKDYAIATEDLNIWESTDNGARIAGTLKKGALCYLLADKDADWIYVESGDVRGFAKASALQTGEEAAALVEATGEENYSLATEKIEPEDNAALYYTITSTKSGVPNTMQRVALVEYAQQFIGNPYVWGGTSLVAGADCSGFVQSIFAQYGYYLPRTSSEQAYSGTKIPVEDALPGDLIFYANDMDIFHVVIYAGDGHTVEAKSTNAGIVSGDVNYDKAVWAVRILDDNDAYAYELPSGLGSVHTYMGWQKVTMKNSQQYALRESAGMAFDPEGFGVIDNRYVIACTSTFGNIGDYIDFYQADGTKIPCIIGDYKSFNDAGCNEWGHMNGQCVVEFVVDQLSWYNGHANPGTASCHPEWNQNIVRAEKVGSYYE